MRIIFYTDRKTGEVINHYTPNPQLTTDELQRRLDKFNASEKASKGGVTAEVVEADKFMSYLYKKTKRKGKGDLHTIDELVEILEEATLIASNIASDANT